ncbi:hypothetical protein Nepgr_002695 [Nepenthes gracilis]|uniref:Uncharacterized protein n=1 Tax=Nepenthes gracilis TaxID=150966 RepID=A0AAD3P7B3_NEPGR|nr:hypothetical protein Nepgr_002695 [Nepenthes gracilis]
MLWLWQYDPELLGYSSASRQMWKLDPAAALSCATFGLADVQMLTGDVAVGTLAGSLLDVEKVISGAASSISRASDGLFCFGCSCWPWVNRP